MLLDDPLSAVDAHVGEHIFHEAITGPLSNGVTRILVTHHVHLLSRCDKVIVLEHGRIAHCGTFSELVDQGVEFAGAVDVSKMSETEVSAANVAEVLPLNAPKKAVVASDDVTKALIKSGKTLVKDEQREEGSVSGSAYMKYARAGGKYYVAFEVCVQQARNMTDRKTRFLRLMDCDWSVRHSGLRQSGRDHGRLLVGALGRAQLCSSAEWRAIHSSSRKPLSRHICFIRYTWSSRFNWEVFTDRCPSPWCFSKAP